MQHEVSEHELAGGARLLFIRIPNTITFYWGSYFRAGYRFVNKIQDYELPHLAEHLAFEGTKQYPDDIKFKVEVERDGAYYNATTGFNLVKYYFEGGRDELRRIISLNMSQIYEPLLRPNDMAQEKQVITRELGQKKENDNIQARYVGYNTIIPKMNPDISQRIEWLQGVSLDDMKRYRREFYGTANTMFLLAGDYSDAELAGIIAHINDELVGKPKGSLRPVVPAKIGDFGGKIITPRPFRDNQSIFYLTFVHAGRDLVHEPALSILDALCTGGLSGRVHDKARKAGLAYGVGSGFEVDSDTSEFYLGSQTDIGQLEPLFELVVRELAEIRAGNFDDSELDWAKGYKIGRVRRGGQTPADFADWYGNLAALGLSNENPEEWVGKLRAVDRQAIMRATQKYLRHDVSLLSLVGKGLEQNHTAYQGILSKYLA
ncbi:insulinase family protein [Patescibacteria group bacterium]|nr:MAG: insulinase family protein [Patescibacteria group bacterium]